MGVKLKLNGGKLGTKRLYELIASAISKGKKRVKLTIPYTEQSLCSRIYDSYTVHSVDYTDFGVLLDVTLDKRGLGLYSDYINNNEG